jgi:tripartite-type tricarboxylate transporter receptor subunit TctC
MPQASVRLVAALALATVMGAAVGGPALAQSSRTIRFVVPFGPGGTADIMARVLAEQIGKAHGVGTLIENRPGGGGVIATEATARAAADGNTVLLNANAFIINPHLRKLTYDPLTSFEPLCQLVSSPQVIVVNGTSAYHSLVEMLDAARARPGVLTLASVGPASTQQLAFEELKHRAGVNMIHVPFIGGNAPAVNALLGNHVDSALVNFSEVVDQLGSGNLRALAVTAAARIGRLPEVPTVAELGYPNFEADVWFGAVVPARTPAPAVAELIDWLTEAMAAPEVRPKLAALNVDTVGRCGAAFATDLRRRFDEYGRAIRESNIKME